MVSKKCSDGKKQPGFNKSVEFKSKIRRTNANARERNRMRGLNDALDTLRMTVPQILSWSQDETSPKAGKSVNVSHVAEIE